jgi:Outer membrane lipoprotein-sorting protein
LKSFRQLKSLSTRLLLALALFCAAAAKAQTNGLSDAEIQGRALAQQLCELKPETNFNQSGILKIKNRIETTNLLARFITRLNEDGWENIYKASHWRCVEGNTNIIENHYETIYAIHRIAQPIKYEVSHNFATEDLIGFRTSPASIAVRKDLAKEDIFSSFAGSDFSIADLGLEFFHWPQQKILPKPTSLKLGREYTLIESTCPNPPANGYSRVRSWIDKDTGGILEAEAYDANGKLLKEFAPKSTKKVNGQWQVEEIEIRNVQTGSRSRIKFDLEK